MQYLVQELCDRIPRPIFLPVLLTFSVAVSCCMASASGRLSGLMERISLKLLSFSSLHHSMQPPMARVGMPWAVALFSTPPGALPMRV